MTIQRKTKSATKLTVLTYLLQVSCVLSRKVCFLFSLLGLSVTADIFEIKYYCVSKPGESKPGMSAVRKLWSCLKDLLFYVTNLSTVTQQKGIRFLKN